MTPLTIQDVPISFPFEPYSCQIDYMRKVIEALDTSGNALLESPTGTGKTLCLLVASLAWLQKRKNNISMQKTVIKYDSGPSNKPPPGGGPGQQAATSIIIYASRTHSQLSQVISELRASGYTPKMTVMGSREQLCIHEKISKLKGAALNHACSASGAQRKCTYKNNLENYTSSAGILDIEELAELGKEDQVCPYFLSRQNATSSELILLPYNYLIDASIRATLKVEWNDAIVILDEAHNLEKVASDASSFSLSSADIAACIQEMKNVIKLLKLQSSSESSSGSGSSSADKKPLLGGDVGRKPTLQRSATILKALFDLEALIDKVPVSTMSGGVKMPGGDKCAVLPGQWLIDALQKVGFNPFTAAQLIAEIRVCADFILEDANSMMGASSFGVGGSGATVPDPKLVSFASSLNKIFKSSNKKNPRDNKPNTDDYRVFLKEELRSQGRGGRGGGNEKKRVLNYWCFSPGVAMEDLKALGVRSLILTSGTLSPMDAFKEDMKVPFSVELENPHVIDRNQIWISTLASGPSGKQLLSTYERRDTSEYKDELGKSILSICQNMLGGHMSNGTVHPRLNGGVLVFFPSYGTMETASERWKETGLWMQLCQTMGKVVSETQSKTNNWTNRSNVSNAHTSYNRNEKWTSGGKQNSWKGSNWDSGGGDKSEEKDIVAGIIQEFEGALSQHGKCLLLAVCRGKVSEGIDFKDNKGRVAIMTGIPFSPFMDPWVVLKKGYLDDNCKLKGLFFSSTPSTSGQDVKSAVYKPQYKPPSQYQPSVQNKPSSLILSGTLQAILPSGGPVATKTSADSVPAIHSSQQQSSSGSSSGRGSSSQRLTGQAWYVQSASRAVNQALGRVIRHKHDWGAVFLLDSRYQRSDQQQQLSSWIRPRVSKHASFPSALEAFRSFCTAALENKALAIKEEKDVKGIVPHYRKPFIPPTLDKDQYTFQKSVVVQSSALIEANTEEKDIHYINPSLATSQNSSGAGTDIKSTKQQGFSLLKTTNPTNITRQKHNTHDTSSSEFNSMSKMFTMIKNSSQSSIPTSRQPSGLLKPQSSHTQSQLAPFKSPLEHTSSSSNSHENVLARKMRQYHQPPSRSLSGPVLGLNCVERSGRENQQSRKLSQNDAFTSAPRGGTLSSTAAAAVTSTLSSTSSNSQCSQSQKSEGGSGSGAFFNMSTLQTSTQEAEKKRKAEGKVKFKALIGKLTTKLSPQGFKNFVAEMKKISASSKASGGQIENISEVRNFVDSILLILISELSSKLLNEALDVLATLFQEKHEAIFHSTARNIIRQLSYSQGVSGRGESYASSPSTSVSTSSSPQLARGTRDVYNLSSQSGSKTSPSVTLDANSANNKRGFQMMNNIKRSHSKSLSSSFTSSPVSKQSKDIFSALKNINIEKMNSRSSSEVSCTQQEKVKKARLDCIICCSHPTRPLINECGHIACEECWGTWLKVQRTCPLCRVETHKSNLSRLVLK